MAKHDECVCGCRSIHKVVIYRQGCTYRVEPGRLVVHPGAKVTFFPMAGTRSEDQGIKVWVPVGLAPKAQVPLDVDGPTPVQVGDATGVFPYSVYVPGDIGPDFAEGGSAPRIIVADP